MAFLTSALLAFLPTVGSPGDEAPRASGCGEPEWFEGTWPELMEEAAASGRIVVVDFWADWCKPCKKMLAVTLRDETVVKELGELLCYSVDVDSADGRPLTKEYRIKSYPTFLFLDPDGSLRDRLGGYFPPEQFVAELRRIKRNEGTLGALRQAIENDPTDLAIRFELAKKLYELGDVGGYEEQVAAIRRLDPEERSLPSRELKLERIIGELRKRPELVPLYAFLKAEREPHLLFEGWYEVWRYEGQLASETEDEATAAAHRRAWVQAARTLWDNVPADKVARFGNYVAWSFYELHEELGPEDHAFALEVARRAAAAAGDEAAVIDTLACCLFVVGSREQALEYVRHCIELEPDNAEWRQRLSTFSR